MKLALHIGTARTGTTSLQVWCAGNRDGLGRQGICYPTTLSNEAHRALVVYGMETNLTEPILARFGIQSAEDHEAFRSQLRSDLSREVEASRAQGHRTWLMSNELVHSKINSPKTITRLHALLRPHFDQITVYLHLRPQVDLLISNTTQRARNGRAVTRAELTRSSVGAKSSYFNYNKFIGFWEDVFGPHNLRVIPYRRVPDITGVLIRDLGIDMTHLPAVERLNPGLGWQTLALANVVNAGFAALKLAAAPDLHLDELPGHDKLQMGRRLAQEVQARFDISNAKLASRRSDIEAEDLTPDWAAMEEDGNLHLVEAPSLYAEQLAQMVRRLAQDHAMERWRRHIAEGRLAALSGDAAALDEAKRAADEAAAELDRLARSGGDDAATPDDGPDDTQT